jgi:hypothetical protein
MRHLGLKIVSVGLAALLWALVSGEQVVERALRIPLEFTNIPADLELVNDPPDLVDVRVRGSSGAIGRIAPGELVAVLDLAGAGHGAGQLFHLTTDDIRAPFGVEVVQVNPSTVSMSLEVSASKVVPVVPTFQGNPADGYVVGTVSAIPSTVELVGPAGILDTVMEAITDPVVVTGAAAPFVRPVTVGSPDPAVRLRQPVVARVIVNITAAPVELRVDGVPVQVRNATRPTVITPRQVTVRVRGSREQQDVEAAAFDAYVDVDGLRPGSFDLEVRVVPPSKLGVISVEPPRVRVTIR